MEKRTNHTPFPALRRRLSEGQAPDQAGTRPVSPRQEYQYGRKALRDTGYIQTDAKYDCNIITGDSLEPADWERIVMRYLNFRGGFG
jgi:hypothetical protein